MKKIIVFLLICLLPMVVGAGDNWILYFSDGATVINGTDVCVSTGQCLTDAANASGDITAVNTNGNYLTGGGVTGAISLLLNETYLNATINSLSSSNSSWNQTHATSLYYPLYTNTHSYYNSTDFSIADYYLLDNPSTFWNSTYALFNKTYADTLYAGIGAGNSSWDETYANGLYYPLYTNTHSYYNSTDFSIADYYLHDNPSGFWNNTYAAFNKTYADTLYAAAGAGNASWNQSHANTLYADISVTGDNSSWNQTYADGAYAAAGSGNSSWNETYADTLYIEVGEEGNLNTNSSDYWDDMGTINATQMEDNGGTLNILITWLSTVIDNWLSGKDTDDLTEGSTNLYDNQSWNETWADTQYAGIGAGNASWNETYADTLYLNLNGSNANSNIDIGSYFLTATLLVGDILSGNGVETGLNLSESNLLKPTDDNVMDIGELETGRFKNLYLGGNVTAEYFLGNISKAVGLSGADNSSWNQTHASTLYATIGAGNSSWNESYADTLYYDLGNSFGYYNSTDFSIDDYYLLDNPSGFWNDTYALFNKTYADTLYAGIGAGNSSWNESYADTLYYDISTNPNSYYNSTDFSIADYYLLDNPSTFWNSTYALFNKTYADTLYHGMSISLPAENITTGTFGTGNYVMDTNLTVEKIVLENNVAHYIEDNSTCILIHGSTSILEIC